MKKLLTISIAILAFSFAALAQGEMNSKGEPVVSNKDNAPVEWKAGEKIIRGDALVAGTKKVSVEKALKNPDKYAGKIVAVNDDDTDLVHCHTMILG